MSTVWTRLTGWLLAIGVIVTEVWALLPALSPEAAALSTLDRLLPLLVTLVCAAAWVAASLAARRRPPRPDLRKAGKAGKARKPGRCFGFLVGAALLLGTAAGLAPAVGPDGEDGRWTQQVLRAGGGTYAANVAEILSEPRRTGVSVNEQQVFNARMVVEVPWGGGESRRMTLDDVETLGEPEQGDGLSLMFAPNALDLGARSHEYSSMSGIAGLWIMILGLFGGLLAGLVTAGNAEDLHRLRRFDPRLHLPAAIPLVVGVALDLVVAFAWPPTWLGWLLALAAASTPVIAARWVSEHGPSH
ncbi:hypothetical protein [Kitasatospora sp. NBC_00458]|uniref:hypothetical protein n=1 Tax=Kitasatospora sp. NBC_00458 TaxID=2903568 RepID=UPI002E17C2BB